MYMYIYIYIYMTVDNCAGGGGSKNALQGACRAPPSGLANLEPSPLHPETTVT